MVPAVLKEAGMTLSSVVRLTVSTSDVAMIRNCDAEVQCWSLRAFESRAFEPRSGAGS